jgi:hypothetical protein
MTQALCPQCGKWHSSATWYTGRGPYRRFCYTCRTNLDAERENCYGEVIESEISLEISRSEEISKLFFDDGRWYKQLYYSNRRPPPDMETMK